MDELPRIALFGAGGHAHQIVEMIDELGGEIAVYSDPVAQGWLSPIRHVRNDDDVAPKDSVAILGLGAVTPDGLLKRLSLYRRLRSRGFEFRSLVHPSATVSKSATVASGALVLAGSVVQPRSRIEAAAIVNSGAIVEHHASIGEGTHIAPGAVILGGATIGEACMIGAGSVILPGADVPDQTLVPALERYPGQPRQDV